MKNKKLNSGIYQIRNLINGKIYIGSTINFYSRKNNHFGKLNKNKHPNKHLQNAYNKYGKENFKFEIIFYCFPKDMLFYEQMGLDSYEKNMLYNSCSIAINPLGDKLLNKKQKKGLTLILDITLKNEIDQFMTSLGFKNKSEYFSEIIKTGYEIFKQQKGAVLK